MSESLRIGSDVVFPAEGLPPEELLSPKQRQLLLERQEVPLDAQERFERTLERLGYEPVTELPNGYRYPTVDEWLALRAKPDVSGWTRHAPAMVRHIATGEIRFCKAHVGRIEKKWGGLKREAEVLRALPEQTGAPRYVHYEPASNDGLELLITEAIHVSEYAVTDRSDWTAATVHAVVKAFRTLETISMSKLPEHVRQPVDTIERNWKGALPVMTDDVRVRAEEVLEKFQKSEQSLVVIHGDASSWNVLVSEDRSNVRLIDWERASAGYPGQDTGRLLWEFMWNSNNGQAERLIEEWMKGDNQNSSEQRRISLMFGVVLEALRWLRHRANEINRGVKPEREHQIHGEIRRIEAKALAILQFIEHFSLRPS